jgi:RNA polymerase-binding transcription factor DksA
MDTIKTKRHQDKLLRRRDQIRATIKRLERETHGLAGERNLDWLDQASDERETWLLDRLNEGYRHELGKIETALERMLAGSYGFCSACRRPIEEGRLDLFPESDFCWACQEVREEFGRV